MANTGTFKVKIHHAMHLLGKIGQNRIIYILCILLFGVVLVNKTLDEDRRYNDYNDMRSVIKGDASGYYVYLPAFFTYNFNVDSFPKNIEEVCGNGFQLKNNKVVSKYPLGVAIAYSPFFLVANQLANQGDGFSPIYHRAIRIAAVFYCIIGLLFCFVLFAEHFNSVVSFIALAPLFYGTNLIYYTFRSPGYSHVVSFCLIASFLYALSVFKRNNNHWCKWILPVLFGFIISVRMTNGIVLLLIPFWNSKGLKSGILFIRNMIYDYKYLGFWIFAVIIFLLPQLIYNHYLNGSIFAELYPGEHFTNITNLKWKVVLFGANNGLYIYTPLFLIFTTYTFIAFQERVLNAILILLFFITITLMYSAWSSPNLGCAFSHRGFLDFLVLFSFPFVAIIDRALKNRKWISIFLNIVLVWICCSFTLGIYDNWWYCFYGKNDFDYHRLIDDYYPNDLADSNIIMDTRKEIDRKNILLKAFNNKYVCTEDGLNHEVVANRDNGSAWETFTLIMIENNYCVIRSFNNSFLSVELNQGNRITATRPNWSTWEKISMIPLDSNFVAFKGVNGKYFSVNDKSLQLFASADSIGNQEKFKIIWK